MADERPLTPLEAQQVMERAWKLQGERDAAERQRAELADKARAGAELGLDPGLVREAEAMVRVQAEGRSILNRQRTRLHGAIAGGVLAVGMLLAMGTVGWWVGTRPSPAFERTMVDPAWHLETSPGSVATLTRDGQSATIAVSTFTPDALGRFWVNLESAAPEHWGRHETVRFEARGDGLQNVRLYLETPERRWRGPQVPLTDTWTTHTLSLADFEYQERDGDWKTRSGPAPSGVKTLSFKLGWYVNEPTTTGTASLRDLRVE